ncbi:hypothetical protein BDZ89DRAFT_1070641 [Hymenopellis radicata]|nr:hypothetical protein BDZ89DRAFT_1070641 [Hymenopellis radicata]
MGRWVVRPLGFGNNTGIERGSFAADYQSVNYGGYIPRGSYFSEIQSETKIPFYARVLQIGVGILLIRSFYTHAQSGLA